MFAFAKRRCAYDSEDDSEEQMSSGESSDSSIKGRVSISSDSEDSNNNGDENDPTPLREKLLQVLTNIHKHTSCEFAVGKAEPDLTPLPGIKIAGYGNVSLPITERHVEDLRKHFQQAPYGLGEATLIDKAVRDSWQLDPDKFEITNPQFNIGIGKLVEEVKNSLGCSKLNVTSQLYKLLLYEPGGHFKPHRDTEKHPGMFATLIVQVPSVFTGGDLVVKHNSQEKRVMFSAEEAAFQCIYAAHYADCEHELTEITSGYRMALVYSLCWDGNGVVPSPPDVPTNNLANLLNNIEQVVPGTGMVAWALDHQYSKNSLLQRGAKALKGSDKLIYSSLQGANKLLDGEKKLEFFIVEATRTDNMYGECTEGYGRWGWGRGCTGDCFELTGDCDTEYEYKVIGVDGHEWDSSLEFDINVRKDVLNEKSKKQFWGECHEGECSGPSGNEGASKSNWYCRYVLVVFPKENAIKVVYKNSVGSGINYLRKELDKEGAKKSVKKLADDIVDLCIMKKSSLREDHVVAILKILMEMKEEVLLKKVLQMLSEPFLNYYQSNYSRYSFSSGNSSPTKVGFGFPSEKMSNVVNEVLAYAEGSLSQQVINLVKTCPPTHFKHVMEFLQQCPDVKLPKDDLLTSVVQKVVSSQERLSDDIVVAVGQVILNHPTSCSQFVKPFLDLQNLHNLKMINNILAFWTGKTNEDLQTNQFYQLTFARFWEVMQQHAQGGKQYISQYDVDAFVTGVELLINRQETTKFNSLIDGVMKHSSSLLITKLLSAKFCQSASVATSPARYLIQARVNQLKPIVQTGKPTFNWCLPTAVVPNYPDIQAFLRGPERHIVYSKFTSRTKADKFRRECRSYLCDVDVRIDGVRNETTVYLTKSSSLTAKHDAAMKVYLERCNELKKLEAKLQGVKPELICL